MQLNRQQKTSIIIRFIEKLKENNSWAGETHVQKAMYFLQNISKLPMGFNFILYKHGPFSFDFRDELSEMLSNELLENKIVAFPYGPSLTPTSFGEEFRDQFSDSIDVFQEKLDFVAKYLGDKGVVELEQMGTALYVTLENSELDKEARVNRITQLKPHIKTDEANWAIESVDKMRENYKQKFEN